MSSLPADASLALKNLLQSLSAADNEVRSQAENSLNSEWLKPERLEILLVGLAEQSIIGEDDSVSIFK